MKIDEKIVNNYFESSYSPVDKEGYLYKKGEIKTSYQKRWCVLKGNLLFYKERQSDRDALGVIVLEGCTVQLCESEEQFAFSLVWSEPGLRTYKFSAQSQSGLESWIKALLSASHGYLSVLVMDMEKKYRDTLSALSVEQASVFNMPTFNTAHAGFAGSYQGARMPAQPPYPLGSLGPGQMLQPSPYPSKAASKRSPKLWPKRSANVAQINTPSASVREWPGISQGPKEEFTKLHEEFGKEVKALIADWSKQAGADVQEENLIDFG